MAGENLTPPDGQVVGLVGSPLGGQFHSSEGSEYPPAEEIETIETVTILNYGGDYEPFPAEEVKTTKKDCNNSKLLG